MATIIQLRRDSAANWTSVDPVLAEGEMGIETDTLRLKIGNGVDKWTALPYYTTPGGVTSVAMSVPTGLEVSGSPITSSGTLAVTLATGYSIPTTAKQSDWDSAFGWGNHASAGYLTSETDPVFSGSDAAAITATDISNWDSAYGWGNHASAGYLDSSDIDVSVLAYDSNLASFLLRFTLPTVDGTAGQALVTDGSGSLSFTNFPSGLPAIGSDGQVLTVVSGEPKWANNPAGFSNPMTTAGDLIVGDTGGTAIRLAAGTDGDVLTLASGVPTWAAATGGGDMLKSENLSGLTDYSAARSNLGLAIGTDVQAYDADTAKTDVAQNFTAPQRSEPTTDNDLSFALSAKNNFTCTPTGAGTLTFTDIATRAGQSGFIKLVNTNDFAISTHADTIISTADLATISASGTYLLSYFCDGTDVFVVASQDLTL